MGINFNYLSYHVTSFFKENALSTLTNQQKKVTIVSIVAINILAVCYFLSRCYLKAKKIQPRRANSEIDKKLQEEMIKKTANRKKKHKASEEFDIEMNSSTPRESPKYKDKKKKWSGGTNDFKMQGKPKKVISKYFSEDSEEESPTLRKKQDISQQFKNTCRKEEDFVISSRDFFDEEFVKPMIFDEKPKPDKRDRFTRKEFEEMLLDAGNDPDLKMLKEKVGSLRGLHFDASQSAQVKDLVNQSIKSSVQKVEDDIKEIGTIESKTQEEQADLAIVVNKQEKPKNNYNSLLDDIKNPKKLRDTGKTPTQRRKEKKTEKKGTIFLTTRSKLARHIENSLMHIFANVNTQDESENESEDNQDWDLS